MVNAVQRFFSLYDFDIFDGTRQRGHIITPFIILNPAKGTVITLDDVCYKPMAYPKPTGKWWQPEFTFQCEPDQALYLNDRPLVVARPQRVGPGGLPGRRGWVVEYKDCTFEIGNASLAQGLVILESSPLMQSRTQEIGKIQSRGWFSGRIIIDLPDRLPLYLQIYFLWLSCLDSRYSDANS